MTVCVCAGGDGADPITGWSSCSAMCSEGTVYRTVTSASPPYEQFNITAICFGSCPGQCYFWAPSSLSLA